MAFTFNELHRSRDINLGAYLVPASLDEALAALAAHGGQARVVAGGTDVIPLLRGRKLAVEALVDVTHLPGMDLLERNGDAISIGGAVTHAQAAASPIIKEGAGLLAQGASSVGSPQIRNQGTLAGNLVNGQPAADTSIPLLALDASVTIASAAGEREVRLRDFFLDQGRTALDPGKEILTRIQFIALGPNQGGAYQRLAKRKALALPMLVAAVVVGLDEERQNITRVGIALGPVAPIPTRPVKAEALLIGAKVSRLVVEEAARLAMDESSPRDSCLRGSCDYRREMVQVFVRRGLTQALARAGAQI
jgi:aerobic carbon-monoxide dehydrogenase medium subunit